MMRMRRSAGAAGALALALALGGCGGGDDTIVTDDGTVTVDRDGDSLTIDTEDGSATITGESDGELPEGWPDEVPVPEGGTVVAGAAVSSDGQQGWSASITYPDTSVEDLAAEVKSSMESAGFSAMGEFTSAEGAVGSYEGSGLVVTATVAEEDGATLLGLIVGREG